ncbi:MAG: class I SAM-dependent methyltransferase [Gemmatimonadales bacterium]|nr:class I SAM-dependent methyltransferase [Gemmatimonadales bacterium]MBA3554053.1 class I SAM-dependent methyltransferase [Gemmatimonadales bacterium]
MIGLGAVRIGALLLVSVAFSVRSSAQAPAGPDRAPDVVFVATPLGVVDAMLNLARVTESDVVFDLGSGDGRIVIAAAKHYGARSVGIEIDSNLVAESRRSAEAAGVGERAEFRRGNLFATDLRRASVVTLYLGRTLNERLRPILLRNLRPGTRVVSQNFDMGDWRPDSVVLVRGRNFGETPVHLWVIPANVAGTWDVTVEGRGAGPKRFQLVLAQRYQALTGEVRPAVGELLLERARLRADSLIFALAGSGTELQFQGGVEGNTASGTVGSGAGAEQRRWRAARVR